ELRLNMAIAPTAAAGQGNRLGVRGGDLAGFPNARRLEADVTDDAPRVVAGVLDPTVAVSPNQDLGDGLRANAAPLQTAFPYITYSLSNSTKIMNPNTFLYDTGPIKSLDDANWNLRQYYKITRTDKNGTTVLGDNLASTPDNVGQHSTPNYADLMAMGVHDL